MLPRSDINPYNLINAEEESKELYINLTNDESSEEDRLTGDYSDLEAQINPTQLKKETYKKLYTTLIDSLEHGDMLGVFIILLLAPSNKDLEKFFTEIARYPMFAGLIALQIPKLYLNRPVAPEEIKTFGSYLNHVARNEQEYCLGASLFIANATAVAIALSGVALPAIVAPAIFTATGSIGTFTQFYKFCAEMKNINNQSLSAEELEASKKKAKELLVGALLSTLDAIAIPGTMILQRNTLAIAGIVAEAILLNKSISNTFNNYLEINKLSKSRNGFFKASDKQDSFDPENQDNPDNANNGLNLV